VDGVGVEQLRRDAAGLEPGEAALALHSEIWERSPSDVRAANMIGRSLEALGQSDENEEHWQLVVELQPGNDIAKDHARRLRHRSTKTESVGHGEAMTDPSVIRAYYEATTDRMRRFVRLERHEPSGSSRFAREPTLERAEALGARARVVPWRRASILKGLSRST
jgi:hypothetical protein